MIFTLISTGASCSLLQSYTIGNLNAAADQGDVVSASGMVKQAITAYSLPKLEPNALRDILDADKSDGLPLTHHIISKITAENLNLLRPIVIRYLFQKSDKATAQQIIKIIQKNPQMLLSINPELVRLALMSASYGFAQDIARTITPDLLVEIKPSIIIDLINANYREVGAILIPLITYENIKYLDPSIQQTLSGVSGYAKHIENINQQLNILNRKEDMESFYKDRKKKRFKK